MIYESELYHHGVKGQRWGVRRNRETAASVKQYYKAKYNVQNKKKAAGRADRRQFLAGGKAIGYALTHPISTIGSNAAPGLINTKGIRKVNKVQTNTYKARDEYLKKRAEYGMAKKNAKAAYKNWKKNGHQLASENANRPVPKDTYKSKQVDDKLSKFWDMKFD